MIDGKGSSVRLEIKSCQIDPAGSAAPQCTVHGIGIPGIHHLMVYIPVADQNSGRQVIGRVVFPSGNLYLELSSFYGKAAVSVLDGIGFQRMPDLCSLARTAKGSAPMLLEALFSFRAEGGQGGTHIHRHLRQRALGLDPQNQIKRFSGTDKGGNPAADDEVVVFKQHRGLPCHALQCIPVINQRYRCQIQPASFPEFLKGLPTPGFVFHRALGGADALFIVCKTKVCVCGILLRCQILIPFDLIQHQHARLIQNDLTSGTVQCHTRFHGNRPVIEAHNLQARSHAASVKKTVDQTAFVIQVFLLRSHILIGHHFSVIILIAFK